MSTAAPGGGRRKETETATEHPKETSTDTKGRKGEGSDAAGSGQITAVSWNVGIPPGAPGDRAMGE